MPGPSPSPDPGEIMDHVDQALQGLELEPEEATEILNFANREVPHLQTPATSYLVLGSYRDSYERRLRIVQNELGKRIRTYPFLLGDLPEIDVKRLPTFRIRFYLIAAYCDHIVAIFEQDAGGEVTELGLLSSTPFFKYTHALPRDYAWMTGNMLETREDVMAAAVNICFSDELDAEEIEDELISLAEEANKAGIDIEVDEIRENIEDREATEQEPVTYSWVQLNEFRLFELHGRCLAWTVPDDLRKLVDEVP